MIDGFYPCSSRHGAVMMDAMVLFQQPDITVGLLRRAGRRSVMETPWPLFMPKLFFSGRNSDHVRLLDLLK